MTTPDMSMGMVERVAEALWKWIFEEEFPARGTAGWHLAMEDARAAIETMREPTEAMCAKGASQLLGDDPDWVSQGPVGDRCGKS